MTKFVELKWKIPPDQICIDGVQADRWTEDEKAQTHEFEENLTFKVDEDGFFIQWKGAGKSACVLELTTVNDIRPGAVPSEANPGLHAKLKGKHGDGYEKKSCAVCSGLDMVQIHLLNIIFKDEGTAEKWSEGVRKLILNPKMANACPKVNLTKHWRRLLLCETPSGKVAIKNVSGTFAAGKNEQACYDKLKDLELPNEPDGEIEKDQFTFEKFWELYLKLCPRNDILKLFKSISKQPGIPMPKLIEFMNDVQRDSRLNEILFPSYGEKRCMEIITRYEKNEELVKKKQLGKDALLNYMMSDENAPVILDRLDIYQDMDQPLNHYYINSSHNTYLIGKQFGGKSSVEIYRQVLLSGSRCVELDCWDGKGKNNNEVILTHGKAMCTEVLFKDAVKAIAATSFQASDYPVILSFENHCNRNNQEKMAKYSAKAFGKMLLKEPFEKFPLKPGQPLPPPRCGH